MKLFKETIIGLRIIRLLLKELKLETKTLKHKCKMVDVYKQYGDTDFIIPTVREWNEELLLRIKAIEKVVRNE